MANPGPSRQRDTSGCIKKLNFDFLKLDLCVCVGVCTLFSKNCSLPTIIFKVLSLYGYPKSEKLKKTLSYVKFIQSYFGNLVDIICEVLMATTNWI